MKNLNIQSNNLWLLTLSYSTIIVIANWFDARLIKIVNLVTDAGTLIFPLTFLLSDLITEVYGYKYARRAIWCGFLFNGLFIVYGQIVIHLPGPDYPNNNALFDAVMTMNTRVLLASAISYICAEPLNSIIMAKLKLRWQGRAMGARFIASTVAASGLDSWIFGIIAFYGMIQIEHLLSLILTMWLIKVMVEITGLPISVSLAAALKRVEKLDVYDLHTKFGIFSLDTHYTSGENRYLKAPGKTD
ncbi:hypothetical protein AQUSIP_23200 [Aquicella siphonis]|uniref:Probable queuosine precursor transporter n=1 Tax=Aquicella siphonis TaxID=254247 RepID=A0A5E4PKZ4_9COXI|nr:queuosine precursor transporter [Aquicella siphonis]VVC76993.1 hypothetical protein AQUSIP_23200 [Aquicella siphonis]